MYVINIDNIELSIFKPKVIFDNFEINGVNKKDISNIKLEYNQNNIKMFVKEYMFILETS